MTTQERVKRCEDLHKEILNTGSVTKQLACIDQVDGHLMELFDWLEEMEGSA